MTRPIARLRGVGQFHPALSLLLPALLLSACRPDTGPEVIVYTSQDQVYAEPILNRFTEQTGIRTRTVYDSEAVKTTGLANRLLAERHHPQCDVFWNNEELRTRQLDAAGLFRETNGWASFGYRSRRLVINTNLLDPAQAPRQILDLTNTAWRGRLVLAYPLFGTTATHFLALRQQWGPAAWQAWCQALHDNHPFLVDGNSVVVQWVGRGDAPIGWTDSDDIAAGQRQGYPIVALAAGSDMLRIPNTVAVIRQAPHPEAAQQLFEYLQRDEVILQLVQAHALESASPPSNPFLAETEWSTLLEALPVTTDFLKKTFLRR